MEASGARVAAASDGGLGARAARVPSSGARRSKSCRRRAHEHYYEGFAEVGSGGGGDESPSASELSANVSHSLMCCPRNQT